MSCSRGAHRVLLSLIAMLCACQLAFATEPQDRSIDTGDTGTIDTDRLANQILELEIAWQKINQELYLEGVEPAFARNRRTWVYDIGNSLATEGGLIAVVALYFHNVHDNTVETDKLKVDGHGRVSVDRELSRKPNHIRGSEIAAGIIPQIAGQAIGAAGSTIELFCDAGRSRNLHRRKLDGKAVTARVQALKGQIDRLLDEYSSKVASGTNSDSGTDSESDSHRAEGRILRDIRDRALMQFADFEARAAGQSVLRITENSVSLLRNVVGGIGNSINVDGLTTRSRFLNGNGSILNLTAASLITIRPLLTTTFSEVAAKRNLKHSESQFPELNTLMSKSGSETKLDFEKDLNALKQVSARTADVAGARRLQLYEQQAAQYVDEDSLRTFDRRSDKHITIRRFRESIFGPTKVVQSSMSIAVNHRRPRTATQDNRFSAAGNLIYVCGQGFNMSELIRERIVDEINHAHLKARDELPTQRAHRTLQTLQSMQDTLHAPL